MKARIAWEQITSSGRRTSWAKTFSAVADDGTKGAKAFTGAFLPDGAEIDLEIGTLVLEVVPTGSVKNGSQEARFHRVAAAGLETIEGGTFDWWKQQLSAQDFARELLDEPEPGNPLAAFTTEQLRAELARRGEV